MFKVIKNWLQGGEITLLKLKNELLEDELEKRDKTIHNLESKLFSAEANYNLLVDDYKKKISEKIGNFSEKIDSVKGFYVFSFEIEKQVKLGDNVIVKYFKSSTEAAKSYKIDGSNLIKKLKETGGNCVINGIQFVLVKIGKIDVCLD